MAAKRRSVKKRLLIILIVITGIWGLLTVWVELEGPARSRVFGNASSARSALILFDPDPIYNFDEQVCNSFAGALAANGWLVQVKTVRAAQREGEGHYDLYVACANTYNWSPDWAVTSFIKNHLDLSGKKTVAITLGSGSTALSKKIFEKKLSNAGADLLSSRTFWLLRPNDESRMKEKNTEVALTMVEEWAKDIAISF